MSRRLLGAIGLAVAAATVALWPHDANAGKTFRHYVYTNDNQTANTVTGFSVAANGGLTLIGQWSTGGAGCPPYESYAGTYAAIARHGGNPDILFAANNCGNTVSVFSGASRGDLKLLAQAPVAAVGDTSIAAAGNCVVFGLGTGEIDSYQYPQLTTPVSTITLPSAIDGMAITTSGGQTYLAAAVFSNAMIGVATLSPACALGAPTAITTSGINLGGNPAGLAFNSNSTVLYVGDANANNTTTVEAFTFPGGTPLVGNPYFYATGTNSNTVLVSNDNRCLFVGNEDSSTVTAIPLGAGGIPGPNAMSYPVGNSGVPSGMAMDAGGKMFYVASGYDNTVTTELIGRKCSLTEAPGTPVGTGAASGTRLDSLTVTP
jgi:hypothetical protein